MVAAKLPSANYRSWPTPALGYALQLGIDESNKRVFHADAKNAREHQCPQPKEPCDDATGDNVG